MKKIYLLLALVVSVIVSGCATNGVTVLTDQDPQVNFSQYHTYNWKYSKRGYQPSASTVAVIQTSLDTDLAAKGYVLSSHPDFLVTYHVVRRYQQSVSQVVTTSSGFAQDPYAYGPSWYSDYGYGFWPTYTQTVTESTPYEEGTLLIDFIDAKTHVAIWRGSASAVVQDQVTNQQNISEGIGKMLANFPSRLSN
jgi:hypothetical protein